MSGYGKEGKEGKEDKEGIGVRGIGVRGTVRGWGGSLGFFFFETVLGKRISMVWGMGLGEMVLLEDLQIKYCIFRTKKTSLKLCRKKQKKSKCKTNKGNIR